MGVSKNHVPFRKSKQQGSYYKDTRSKQDPRFTVHSTVGASYFSVFWLVLQGFEDLRRFISKMGLLFAPSSAQSLYTAAEDPTCFPERPSGSEAPEDPPRWPKKPFSSSPSCLFLSLGST